MLLLLTELYRTPDLPRKERMATIIDHIFGHCYGVGVQERCSDLLFTVKENLEAFYVMKGFNKKRQQIAPQQHPTLQPLTSFGNLVTSPGFGTGHQHTPSSSNLHGQLQRTPTSGTLDGLNVDFDSILGSLNGAGGAGTGGGSAGPDDFDVWAGMSGAGAQDTGAIFVPVDTGGHAEFGTASPNGGLQQWVRVFSGFFLVLSPFLLCISGQLVMLCMSENSKLLTKLLCESGKLEFPNAAATTKVRAVVGLTRSCIIHASLAWSSSLYTFA